MSAVLDALAKYGVRGSLQALLSPQHKDRDGTHGVNTEYVCARKKTKSRRKGQLSVYKVIHEGTTDEGHKARYYQNVEAIDSDDNERASFVGIMKMTDSDMGHSVRRTVRKHQMEHPAGNSNGVLERHSSNQHRMDRAASRESGILDATSSGGLSPCPRRTSPRTAAYSSSDVRNVVTTSGPRVLLTQEHDRRKNAGPRTGPQRRKYLVQEPETRMSSGVLPWQELLGERFAGPEARRNPKLGKKMKATSGLEAGVEEIEMKKQSEIQGRESGVSMVSECSGRQFIQPGLTARESANLVFGEGSQGNSGEPHGG